MHVFFSMIIHLCALLFMDSLVAFVSQKARK